MKYKAILSFLLILIFLAPVVNVSSTSGLVANVALTKVGDENTYEFHQLLGYNVTNPYVIRMKLINITFVSVNVSQGDTFTVKVCDNNGVTILPIILTIHNLTSVCNGDFGFGSTLPRLVSLNRSFYENLRGSNILSGDIFTTFSNNSKGYGIDSINISSGWTVQDYGYYISQVNGQKIGLDIRQVGYDPSKYTTTPATSAPGFEVASICIFFIAVMPVVVIKRKRRKFYDKNIKK